MKNSQQSLFLEQVTINKNNENFNVAPCVLTSACYSANALTVGVVSLEHWHEI